MKGLNLSGSWQSGHSLSRRGSSQASAGSFAHGESAGPRPALRVMAAIVSRMAAGGWKRSPPTSHATVRVASHRPPVTPGAQSHKRAAVVIRGPLSGFAPMANPRYFNRDFSFLLESGISLSDFSMGISVYTGPPSLHPRV